MTPLTNNSREVLHSSQAVEWYTPSIYIEAARDVMGSIDLDPASSVKANQVVKADSFYSYLDNGLTKPWRGCVWLNPPYGKTGQESNQAIWSRYLIEQYEVGITQQAVLLVNATPSRKWFSRLWAYPICFTDHRIKFYNPTGQPNSPTHGNCFVYFGDRMARFVEVFQRFGVVIPANPTQVALNLAAVTA